MLCRNRPRLITNHGLFPASPNLPLARRRFQSGHTATVVGQSQGKKHDFHGTRSVQLTGLERLPTKNIVRNILFGTLFTTPSLFKPGYSILRRIANSKSPLLNPDVNPLLLGIIKPLIYDAFCAGRSRKEIYKTRDTIKGMGYSGVILCYGRENVVDDSNKLHQRGGHRINEETEIGRWRDGNLDTLDMIGEGDWLGVKFTGAGETVTNALIAQHQPSPTFLAAMDAICQKAKGQGCRIWIDAEQQSLQTTIDSWAVELMRRYNTNGTALVYNTIQAYLKSSRKRLEEQMTLASKEGWTMAVKLVRGAYIGNDNRAGIHDTKAHTDESYNGIVRDLLTGSTVGGLHKSRLPKTELFVAGHNPNSVAAAMALMQDLGSKGELKTVPDFGQLQGMADELGCSILQKCEGWRRGNEAGGIKVAVPRVYKCLTWGSVQECMQFLVRRVAENSGGTDRMRDGTAAYWAELKRRMLRRPLNEQ